ncbi:MAG: FixH family protein [Bacteroidia bacterium]|nr:FixH family protein [Bacteroidia bacterium]MDW8235176.1 FixH family protein [Bacteroidia bacterium]
MKVAHAHTQGSNYHIDLYAQKSFPLIQGHNRLLLRVEKEGRAYGGTDVRINPLMFMTSRTHSAPTEQITGGPNSQGYYEAAAFFMMPSNSNEPWKLHVKIGNADSVDIPLEVTQHPNRWVKVQQYIVSRDTFRLMYEMRPAKLATGSQDVTFFLYRRDPSKSMMTPEGYPPASEITKIRLETWMPSMGHGAQGTQDATPVSGKPGHYAGKLGFNMTGDWRVYMRFMRGDEEIGRDSFDLRF